MIFKNWIYSCHVHYGFMMRFFSVTRFADKVITPGKLFLHLPQPPVQTAAIPG